MFWDAARGDQTVARPSGCRIETRLDAWRYEANVDSPDK
jgi:hypothetical protein